METTIQPTRFSERNLGILLVLVSAIAYAWLPIMAKWGYAAGLQPTELLTLRFAIATPIMWLLTWRETPASRTLPRLRLVGIGGVFALVALTAFFALSYIPSSVWTLLLYTYPAMVVLLSRLTGEPFTREGLLALVLTSIGILFTIPLQGTELQNLSRIGLGLGLANAVLYALYIMLSQQVLTKHHAVAHATRWMITGAFLLMVAVSLIRGFHFPTNGGGWASAAGLAVIGTVLAFFTFLAGIKRLGAAYASILSSVEPLATLILSALLLGERLTGQQLIGGAFILASVVVIQLRASTARRDTPLLE